MLATHHHFAAVLHLHHSLFSSVSAFKTSVFHGAVPHCFLVKHLSANIWFAALIEMLVSVLCSLFNTVFAYSFMHSHLCGSGKGDNGKKQNEG
jgi:hypothetical protein